MITCPDYRVRLFLSADLVNSTAFKSSGDTTTSDMYPGWVEKFKQFYLQFPKIVQSHYLESKSCRKDALGIETAPKLWKLVGDEIVFSCRVNSLQHLSCCVNAFLDALEYYGRTLEEDASTKTLDIKGAGWVACNPPDTVTLRIEGGDIRSTEAHVDVVTEEFEQEADKDPAKFDFIGTAIDAGFRFSKYAAADRFSPSAELAYLLADAGDRQLFSRPFAYHGRELLKGVHGNTPYPAISIDCERDPLKRELRTRERNLMKDPPAEPLVLREFIVTYLKMVGVDLPILRILNDSEPATPPASYLKWKERWEVSAKATNEQDDSLEQAEVMAERTQEVTLPLDESVTKFAERISKLVSSTSTSTLDRHLKVQRDILDSLKIQLPITPGATEPPKDEQDEKPEDE